MVSAIERTLINLGIVFFDILIITTNNVIITVEEVVSGSDLIIIHYSAPLTSHMCLIFGCTRKFGWY